MSVPVRFHDKIFVYDGKSILDPTKDNKHAFEEMPIEEFWHSPFFIASTIEEIGLDSNHAAYLEEMIQLSNGNDHLSLLTHSNAPYQWPGPKKTMTLECQVTHQGIEDVKKPSKRLLARGNLAGRIFFKRLETPIEGLPSSRYDGQQGPSIGRLVT